MKEYNCVLQVIEKGTKNKIKIKSKLTESGINKLLMSNIYLMLDTPRQQMIGGLKEALKELNQK